MTVRFVINFRTLGNMFLSSIYVSDRRRNGSFLVKVPPISYVIFTCCENIVEVIYSFILKSKVKKKYSFNFIF
jgi:hypothetical protein